MKCAICVCLAGLFVSTAVAETVLLYEFNHGPGMVYDYSGYDNDGTIAGSIDFVVSDNMTNGAEWCTEILFPGDNAGLVEINGGTELDFTDSFSIQCWIKALEIDDYDRIITRETSSGDSVTLRFRNDQNVDFVVYYQGGGSTTVRWSGASLLDGEYHHIAGVRQLSDNSVRVFVDGVAAVAYSAGTVKMDGTWRIGGGIDSNGDPENTFVGRIDDVKFDNVSLIKPELNFYLGPTVDCEELTADLNGDQRVDLVDFAMFTLDWLTQF